MINRLTSRPLVQRGLGIATAGLLVAGSIFVPAVARAAEVLSANPDTVTLVEDTPKTIPTSDLTVNDTGPAPLTVTLIENPAGATVVLNGNNTITITASEPDQCDPDGASFDYDVKDGDDTTTVGHVTVNITCQNDAPVAANDDDPGGHQDDVRHIHADDLASNDFDVDEDVLHVTAVSNPVNGTVNLTAGEIYFTPTSGVCNPTTGKFDYTVSDGHGGTDTATVTIHLMCNGTNHDPVATNDERSGTEDTALLTTGASLVANDTDADLDPLHVASLRNAVGGTVTLVGDNITFTPAANLCGNNVASFEYDVSDGTDGDDFGVVTIDLTCVNDPAVGNPDSGAVAVNSGPKDYDVLANDTDAEGDPITLQSASVSATAGTASVVAGKVRYTPATVFSGVATITYVISDSHVTSQGTLSVLVGEDNVAPVVATPKVAFGSGRVDDTAPIKISWKATDLGTGVKSYKVQARVGSGAWKTISNGKATSITKAYPFKKDLTFRVKATDKVGNASHWVNSATRRISQYKHTSGSVDYTGSWTKVTGAHKYAFTTGKDKTARLSFTARSILYVAPKTSASGFVKVFVDGNLIGRFKLDSSSSKYDRIIARASWATSGAHKIRIVNDVKGDRTNLAAFVILK